MSLASQNVSRVLFALFLFLTVFTVLSILDLQQDTDRAEDRVVESNKRLDKAEAAASALTDQVRDLGGRPVINPEDLEKALEGRSGTAPTDADVSFAVQLYCADGRCNGRDPSISQVAAAVATYCNRRGECKGPKGEVGVTGQVGEPGPTGPPPSVESVMSAVVTYCSSRNECRGPKGENGANGTDGKDGVNGRGISAVTCVDGQFVVSYSDGTQSDGIGDCQAGGVPPVINNPAP